MDFSQRSKNLNHFVCIPKIGKSDNYLLCIRVLKQKEFKNLKKIYITHLQKDLESRSASTASTASSTTNFYYLI